MSFVIVSSMSRAISKAWNFVTALTRCWLFVHHGTNCNSNFSFLDSSYYLLRSSKYIYINFCMPNWCCRSVCCFFLITTVIPEPFLHFTSLRFSSLVLHPVLSDSRLLKVTGFCLTSCFVRQQATEGDLFWSYILFCRTAGYWRWPVLVLHPVLSDSRLLKVTGFGLASSLSDSRLLKVTCFGLKGPSLIILQVDSTCDLFQRSVILTVYGFTDTPAYKVLNISEGPSEIEFFASRKWIYVWPDIHVYTGWSKSLLWTWWLQFRSRVHWDFLITLYNRVQFLSKLQNLDSDRPQHDRPTARVNAHKHSPLTFILLHSYSHKEKFSIL